MDVGELKKHLCNNPSDIIKILEHYGYEQIRSTNKEIRCARSVHSNNTAIRIRINDNLSTIDFAKNISGDIISLLMQHKGLSFLQVINNIKNILNLQDIKAKKVNPPFGGMFSKILINKNDSHEELQTYDEDILNSYDNCWNEMFLKDGIKPRIQKEFNIGYDERTNRITVPWRSTSGNICGIMGRLNSNTVTENMSKWFPVIPFSKSNTLYGFSENYKELLTNDTIFIGESEKFVLQLASFRYRNCVALGGNNLSDNQIKYILSTNPKKIILCFDEGLDFNVVLRSIDNIKKFIRMREIEVFVVTDSEHKYLIKGGKQSPSDLGKEVFENLINECVTKVI